MARETEVTCPSGLRVVLRSLKGKDIDKLRDRRKMATGEALWQVLDDCTQSIVDRSIYDQLPSFSWADTLVGDQTRAIIALRQATSGNSFDFIARCVDRTCRQRIEWTLELSELPIRQLPEASAAIFRKENLFETELNGTPIKYRLNTGRTRAAAVKYAQTLDNAKLARGNKDDKEDSSEGRALFGVASKIFSVEGVDNVMEWLNDQYLDDINKLVKTMDATDCGVETAIHVVCSGPNGCGLKQEIELPLDKSFFVKLM